MPAFKKVKKGVQVTKCTPETIEKICNQLRLGQYLETAVVMADVGKNTFYEWIKLSHKKPNSIYATLRDAVTKAQAEGETRDLLVIDKCANGRAPKYMRNEDGSIMLTERGYPIMEERGLDPDWSAAAWRLERRYGSNWGKVNKVEITDNGKTDSTLEDEEVRRARIQEKIKKLKLIDDE